MSFATTILIVVTAVVLYYAGMIAYDLYVADKLKSETEENKEELIDVTDQLKDFETFDVNTPEQKNGWKKTLEVFFCKGLSPEKMKRLMTDVAAGTPNEDLNNLIWKCETL